ncbi:MAG TPA: c-type cytochrome [Chromatiaceae bacterium]|nr:c-type cytochrome [Chromatiaceae bacterium]
MNVLLKTLTFSLALTLLFTFVTYLLPQVKGEAPVEKNVDLGSLTMEDFIALGDDIFHNKGTCTLCHKPAPLGRAPDIEGENMVALAEERLADDRYNGEARDGEAYIRESMVDPGRYVVAGWGKKGSNDSESPMPHVDKPPIQLSPMEIDAVIAWLQSKDGNVVTVVLPDPEVAVEVASAASDGGDAGKVPAPAATAEEALARYACVSCHALDSRNVLVGPGLVDVGARLDKDELRQSILDPNADVAEGFPPAMPPDFASKMTVKELEMIIEYLAEKKG